MFNFASSMRFGFRQRIAWLAVPLLLGSGVANAVPSFARQTGQNCVACHAGGQFPELTPYGRKFKLTGYTIGERANPLSFMAVAAASQVASTSDGAFGDPLQTYAKNGAPLFATGSLLIAGKVTNNIGLFSQITYDNYSGQNANAKWQGHSGADNIDLRYADRLVDEHQDLIFGVSLNNNPSISDPWNTAPAWMQYVPVPSPGSSQFADGVYPGTASGGGVAGVTGYMLWNDTIYGELGFYRTANDVFSILSAGTSDADTTHLWGNNNPYWRLAYTREWGPHNLMVGTSGMVAHIYDKSTDPGDSAAYQRIRNVGLDAQYQYLLDPDTVTAQLAYMRTTVDDSANGGLGSAISTPDVWRAKLTYVYSAKYGGSFGYFDSKDSKTAGTAINGFVYEAFWIPLQNIRVGAQYTTYNKFDGATNNYDTFGRNAKDNNTLMLYVWGAY